MTERAEDWSRQKRYDTGETTRAEAGEGKRSRGFTQAHDEMEWTNNHPSKAVTLYNTRLVRSNVLTTNEY